MRCCQSYCRSHPQYSNGLKISLEGIFLHQALGVTGAFSLNTVFVSVSNGVCF